MAPMFIGMIREGIDSEFEANDKDGDGFLDRDEWAAMIADKDNDDAPLTDEEKAHLANFDEADADKDGKVSKEELWNHLKLILLKVCVKQIKEQFAAHME